MAKFQLKLLGTFQLTDSENNQLRLRSDKTRALLAYLILESPEIPVRREQLMDLLWPGFLTKSARQNLRNALYNLRKTFAPLDILDTNNKTVCFCAAHPEFWCDVLHTDSLPPVEIADGSPGLLPGFVLHDCPAFMEWLARQQQLFTQRGLDFVSGTQGPPSENFLPPNKPVTEMKSGLLRRSDVADFSSMSLYAFSANLPRDLTPFFGRESSLQALENRIGIQAAPLLTILGQGGIGKTRLAIAAGRRLAGNYADGVRFVALADLPRRQNESVAEIEERVARAIADQLGIVLLGQLSVQSQLANRLQTQEMLLILDNFEHLIDGARLLWALLQSAQNVQILVTSRSRLGLQSEQVFYVRGMSVPKLPVDGLGSIPNGLSGLAMEGAVSETQESSRPENLLAYASVRLYVDRATRLNPAFRLSDENRLDIVRIIVAVGGMPLGIELAASLVDRYSCQLIVTKLQEKLDLFQIDSTDVPLRHRNLLHVLAESIRLLPRRAIEMLVFGSIFEGGFLAEHLQWMTRQVNADTAPNPEEMETGLGYLLRHAHLYVDEHQRYYIHPLIRQFIIDNVADPALWRNIQIAFAHYYLSMISSHLDRQWQTQAGAGRVHFQLEINNIRAAWLVGVETEQTDLLIENVFNFASLWEFNGRIGEVLSLLNRAWDHFQPQRADNRVGILLTKLGVWRSIFESYLGNCERAIQLAKTEAESGPLLPNRLDAYWSWARTLNQLGHLSEAVRVLTEGLNLAETDAQRSKSHSPMLYHQLLLSYRRQANWQGVRDCFEQGLSRAVEADRLVDQASFYALWAETSMYQGKETKAQHYLSQALALFEKTSFVYGVIYCQLAQIELYLRTQEYSKCQNAIAQLLPSLGSVSFVNLHIHARFLQAWLAFRQGESSVALARCQETIEQATQARLSTHSALYTNCLIYIQRQAGLIQEAEHTCHTAIRLNLQPDSRVAQIEPLASLARISLGQGKMEQAQSYALQSTELLTRYSIQHEAILEPSLIRHDLESVFQKQKLENKYAKRISPATVWG